LGLQARSPKYPWEERGKKTRGRGPIHFKQLRKGRTSLQAEPLHPAFKGMKERGEKAQNGGEDGKVNSLVPRD